jgi:hypothetical protein
VLSQQGLFGLTGSDCSVDCAGKFAHIAGWLDAGAVLLTGWVRPTELNPIGLVAAASTIVREVSASIANGSVAGFLDTAWTGNQTGYC